MRRRKKVSYALLKLSNHTKDIKELGSCKLRKGEFLERVVSLLRVLSVLQEEGVGYISLCLNSRAKL
jgi:hypothetical protein